MEISPEKSCASWIPQNSEDEHSESCAVNLHCLLCAEISALTKSILDSSNGIKDKLSACGLWLQSFESENMPRIVCFRCVNELTRCNRFFEQIAAAEKKLLQMCPIKVDALKDEENDVGDIIEYNTLDVDDLDDNKPTQFIEEVFCEPWMKTEAKPEQTGTDEFCSEDDKPVISATKGRLKKSRPTKKKNSKKSRPYKSTSKKSNPEKSSSMNTAIVDQEEPKTVVEQEAGNDNEPEPNTEEDGSDLEDLTCRKCGKTFPHKVFLKVHKRIVCFKRARESANRLTCDICKATYKNLNTMRKHMKKHAEGVIEYFCDRCGEKCESNLDLIRHMRTHTHPKNPACPICGKILSKRGNMKSHMQLHTNTKPHRCTICDKSYSAKVGLRTHMLSHTGELPFKCQFCGRGYQQKSTLKLHERTHTGERPYKCDLCDYAGIGSGNLRQHVLSNHGIQINVKRPQARSM